MNSMTKLFFILSAAALPLCACAEDEGNENLNALAKQVGKYDNKPFKEKTTVSYNEIEYTVFPLKKGKTEVGAVVQTGAKGFAGPISMMVAFNAKGEICAYKVLSQTETPRWGDVVGEWFQRSGQGNIIGMDASGADLKDKKDGGTVDGISNSTITTRAFLYAINSAYKVYKGEEPEKQVIQAGRGHGGHGGPQGGGPGGPGGPGGRGGFGGGPQGFPQGGPQGAPQE